MILYRSILLLITTTMLFSCSADHKHEEHADDEHEHSSEALSITLWSYSHELFMEYQPLVSSESSEFLIHLTTLNNFKPVTSGRVELLFHSADNSISRFSADKPERDGLYIIEAQISEPGNYKLSLALNGNPANALFDCGPVTVFEDDHAVSLPESEAHGDITFLKEQQWKLSFATEPATVRSLQSSVTATSEVLPRRQSYADIISPVDGIFSVQDNEHLVIPGQWVKKGQVLAVLCPPLGTDNSWAAIETNYQKAKSEYERAGRLQKADAISQRDYEEAERNFKAQQSGYIASMEQGKNRVQGHFEMDDQHYRLAAPISGLVENLQVLPGQKVANGDRLMSIVNPNSVWLRADFYEKDYYQLGRPGQASIRLSGLDSLVHLEKDQIRLLSKGESLNPENRTIPVLFEIKNEQRLFKIGQVLLARFYNGSGNDYLTVPRSAVYQDGNSSVIFVQESGEAFEKRTVETGPSFLNWIAVTKGIEAGERVVSKGAYQVKLASVSTAGAGHGHVH